MIMVPVRVRERNIGKKGFGAAKTRFAHKVRVSSGTTSLPPKATNEGKRKEKLLGALATTNSVYKEISQHFLEHHLIDITESL